MLSNSQIYKIHFIKFVLKVAFLHVLMVSALTASAQSNANDKIEGEYNSIEDGLKNPLDVTVLDLRYSSLSQLPESITKFENLKVLYLTGNDLTALPPFIGRLNNLEELYLEDNFLTSLPREIANLYKLRIIAMPYNEVNSLPDEIMRMSWLTKFDMRGNALSAGDQIKFRNAMTRTEISYAENEILYTQHLLNKEQLSLVKVFTDLTEALKNPAEVYALNLSAKRLTVFPPDILKLKNLQDLDLSDNKLSTIPNEIIELPNLQYINLRSNKISKLPDNIGNLKNLKGLKLGINQIYNLPNTITNLTNLEILDLSFNFTLRALPPNFGNLTHLKELNIYSASIENLPDDIGRLQNLHDLIAFRNKIKYLPASLSECTNLKLVTLGENVELDYLQAAQVLSGCKQLNSLDLRSLNISSGKKGKIAKLLPKVEVIY